ncbi:CHASE4 domain-containing protein [uncultured Methanospirillum sp.]|uniref:sensor histidine kinase n=1 Tax=uncultured Methanospirillum sp. TaxID=262503 RepID=UPI0029C7B6E6|nr:CHASE4 domain-containing protein [uncultured Methanospirillum sp.]
MKRSSILILMNLFLLVAVCGCITGFWFFSEESYNAIERKTLDTSLEYLQTGITDQEHQIITVLMDYAWWDDTYTFATGNYPQFPDDNFNNLTLKNLNIHQITILDHQNRPIYSNGFNSETHLSPQDIPPATLELLIPSRERDPRTALGVINGTPYLFCSVMILHSDASGPPAGTIIFGRQINRTFCDALQRTLHHPVTVTTVRSGSMPTEQRAYGFPLIIPAITEETSDQIGNSFTTLSSDEQYVITFSITRTKDIAIAGRSIIGESLVILAILASLYSGIMTFIFLSVLSHYEHDQEELEAKRQEIRIHNERKEISDNIRRILDVFLEFGSDSQENIQKMVCLTADLLHADCVIYSQFTSGTDRIIASTNLPPGYIPASDTGGKISTYLIHRDEPDVCLLLPLDNTEFKATDPLVQAGNYQVYHGCKFFSTPGNPGTLSVYYQKEYEPGELDQVILNLISNAIAIEAGRGDFQTVLQDYTRQLAEKSHELALTNIDLQERSTLVENLLQRKKELIVQIGHDLRTPLTPIIGLLPYLRKNESNPEKLEVLNRIELGAFRIRALLDKILILQQMDATQTDEKIGVTDIGSIIEMVITQYRNEIEEKNLSVKTDISDSLFARIPDKSLLLVIEELTRNAVRYNRQGGTILFSGYRQDDLIRVCVGDTGNGLSVTEIERIFDYFYKTDLSRHEIDTHGLGLPIVRHILEKYQGTIIVESEGVGKGSQVCFSLPAAKNEPEPIDSDYQITGRSSGDR